MSDFTAAFFLEEDEDGEAALRLVLLEAEPMAPSTPARASTDWQVFAILDCLRPHAA